ncbi:MAG TPA: mechanosensitive ion channel domain-containing protein [Candidatus Dormibacteraeota bacterium]|nr:mechanosensitive ion channel domain-containing protein [Candidatus Dormibacteraeota bacterium]
MKVRQWISAIVLLLLMAAAAVGWLWTRELPAQNDEASATPAKKPLARKAPAARHPSVDLRPLQTARRLGALAATPEEQALAHEAEKTGDHEVDLAFFDALRTAEENPPPLSPVAKEIVARKAKAQQTLKDDQESITILTRKLAAAPESQKDNLQDQIDVAKAQLELDQDELDDATEDLEQAGGDPQAKIKRLQAEHEAADHNAAPAGSAVNPHEQDYQTHTLLSVFRAWQAIREKKALLEQARDEANEKQRQLIKRHDELAAQVEKDKEDRESAKQQAKGFSKSRNAANRETSKASARASLDALKQYTLDQKNLADRGRRLQDEQELSDIYTNWIALVETRERAALHHMIETILWILLALVAVYVAHRIIEHLFTGMTAENKRVDTLRSVVKFATQAVGAIIILFIIFGMPTQVTTVLGLAGAGLTVAMKDFIVAFFGWFILMGRNGIRVGDWVEINGVGGEVVEVGLLKTVLLETGSWNDAGHPTGRRVSFVNSFAIEGHFFNFTTSGQWMWDELSVLIPAGQDPYPVIDGIQKLVEEETKANAGKAEAEWHEATTRYRAKTLSAVPGINVQPTAAGIEVRVRYITRAYERHEARKRLYEAVVEMMHRRPEAVNS